MFIRTFASSVLLCLHVVGAQSVTSSGSAQAIASGTALTTAMSTATSASTKSLGPGEAVVIVPTYVSSLSAVITTTYTTTSTTATTEAGRPTGLPSSLYCDSGYANATGPFCYPNNGTQQIKGKKYSVTWNYEYAVNCTDVYISLQYLDNPNLQLVTSTTKTNTLGFWNYTVESSWLNGKSKQYAQFELIPYNCGESGTMDPSGGPIVELLSKAPTTHEKATPESEVLGLSIGLPLVLFAFLGTTFFVMWWNKGHRAIPNFALRKKGYTGRKQRAVRLADLGENNAEGGETYRDHPQSL